MFTLAAPGAKAGEIIISGTGNSGPAPVVLLNGERVLSGRTIFSSSHLTTLDGANALINIGGLGSIELAPKSDLVISFDERGIRGDLSAGELTVLATSTDVDIRTANGNPVRLKAGETVTAAGVPRNKAGDPNTLQAPWWIWVIVGAAAAVTVAVIVIANSGDETISVSPVR